MTCKVRYVDFYHDEWLAGTIGLDPFDIGVYITACAMIYSRGGAVEYDDLRGAVRCHGHAFKAAMKRLLGGGKLFANGSQITSKRCSNELQKAVKRVSNAVQNGAKGGRPPKEINGLDKAVGYNARAEPRTTNLEEEDSPPCVPPRDEGERGEGGATVPEAVAPVEGKRRPAKQPVPPDWEPDTAGMDYAAMHAGWEDGRLWGEVEQFRDYHLAKGTLLADPDAGFRVWVRNSVKIEARQEHGRKSGAAAQFEAFDRITRYAH